MGLGSAECGVRSAECGMDADSCTGRSRGMNMSQNGSDSAVDLQRTGTNYELREPETTDEGVWIWILLGCVRSCRRIEVCRILGRQLLRSGTSVGANYRAACRAKSLADFISKLGTVEEEADESGFWLEMLVEAEKLEPTVAAPLIQEAGELTAIAVSSINTARKSASRS